MGFKTDSTPLPEHDMSPDIAGVLEDLRTVGVHVEGHVEDFMNMDSDLETAGTLTDEVRVQQPYLNFMHVCTFHFLF